MSHVGLHWQASPSFLIPSESLKLTSSTNPTMHITSHWYWRNIPKLNAARTGLRFASSSFVRIRLPPASAPREAPTPLVFVSSESWDEESTSGYSASCLISHSVLILTYRMSFLAQILSHGKGFTCIENDLTIPDTSKNDSNLMMKHYESGKSFSPLLMLSK